MSGDPIAELLRALEENGGLQRWLDAHHGDAPDPIAAAWAASEDADAMCDLLGFLECSGSFGWRSGANPGPPENGRYWHARLGAHEADAAVIGTREKRAAMSAAVRRAVEAPTLGGLALVHPFPTTGRIASEADIPVLEIMIRDLFADERIPFEPEKVLPALRTILGNPSLGNVWLFACGSETVGYAIVTYGFDLEFNGRDAFLTDLYLVPKWRGRRVGTVAMDILERGAKEAGVHAIHLLVDPSKKHAVRLYEGARYERSHRAFMTKRLD